MQILWIFCMGIAGAASRYALGLFLKPMIPWPTLVINFLGCVLLEVIYQCMPEHTQRAKELKTALGVGFIGAFTTFSTFCNEALGFLQSGHFLLALAYAASGMLSGLLGIALGIATGQRLTKGRVRIDG
ncbi:fluoride efflux transporter FluC [Eubacterium sp.]|uniref:fluoride efflux transporter FluC n=1 Tax=Eubacterium sp. TaxID=142586 RepID=UPI002FC96BAE